MNYPYFQVLFDGNGDLYMVGGTAYQRRTGEIHSTPYRGMPLGTSEADGVVTGIKPSFGKNMVPAYTHTTGILRAGGSGRNLILNSADGGPVEWARIPRVFYPGPDEDTWSHEPWTITRTSASSAILSDGSNPIGEMVTGSAPYGDYVASSYGESDYNNFNTFTLSAIAETGENHPEASLAVSDGSYSITGVFATADGVTWTNDGDALSSLVVAFDGSAQLRYDGDVIAERAAGGNPHSPLGVYTATTLGETNYNGGDPWTATVTASSIAPKVGYVYVLAHFSSGDLTALRGPYHAATLPAPTTDLQPVPIAYSDGYGNVEQYHTGLILI